MSLLFDSATHTYTYNGNVVPSVTQVLQGFGAFAGVRKEVLDAACERGTAVHRACELYDLNTLDYDTVDNIVRPYLAAWRQFVRRKTPEWTHIEMPLYNKMYGYAGTPDRYGTIGGEPWVIDIKTSSAPSKLWGLQTVGYRALVDETCKRATVQLAKDGTYKFIVWKEVTDWPVFLSSLTLTKWRNEHDV